MIVSKLKIMGSYRRSKIVLDAAFRGFTSRISFKSPIQHPGFTSRISFKSPIQHPNFSGFFSYSIIPQKSVSHFGLTRRTQYSPFHGGAKRYYYVDRYQVQHFRSRGPRRWFQNPRNVLIVVLVGSGFLITVYFGNLETIPYSKRTHLVLLPKKLERKLGETMFEEMKKDYKGKILPAIHPESVRVRLISNEIIKALQRGLSHEKVWSDLGYASESVSGQAGEGIGRETSMALKEFGGEEQVEGKLSREDEVLDDNWVQQSRKKGQGQEKGVRSATSHLDGLNWEFLVVDEPTANAFCIPGGKIVVFTGFLKQFGSDAEIATVIGHEVGHAVARHSAESITMNLWFAIIQLILYQFVETDIVNTLSNLFLKLPFSRRNEMEADYIGLLLMASAGYDPRVAPKMYEKSGNKSSMRDYLSTHPSGKKRAQLLAQAKVMEEALLIYRDEIAGRGIEGFL